MKYIENNRLDDEANASFGETNSVYQWHHVHDYLKLEDNVKVRPDKPATIGTYILCALIIVGLPLLAIGLFYLFINS